jgi:hypothetical protein
MVALPLLAPTCSAYWREIGPDSAREPARANPRPSRIDFLPSSITCSGISSYVVVVTNRPTYSVRPFVLGKSAPNAVPAPFADAGTTLEAMMPREALPKSRLRIFSPRGSDDFTDHELAIPQKFTLKSGLHVVDPDFGFVILVMRHGQIVAI